MSTYDPDFHFVVRLRWPGNDQIYVQVLPDGALIFEEEIRIIGRIEPEEVEPLLQNLGKFAKAYDQALAQLNELE